MTAVCPSAKCEREHSYRTGLKSETRVTLPPSSSKLRGGGTPRNATTGGQSAPGTASRHPAAPPLAGGLPEWGWGAIEYRNTEDRLRDSRDAPGYRPREAPRGPTPERCYQRGEFSWLGLPGSLPAGSLCRRYCQAGWHSSPEKLARPALRGATALPHTPSRPGKQRGGGGRRAPSPGCRQPASPRVPGQREGCAVPSRSRRPWQGDGTLGRAGGGAPRSEPRLFTCRRLREGSGGGGGSPGTDRTGGGRAIGRLPAALGSHCRARPVPGGRGAPEPPAQPAPPPGRAPFPAPARSGPGGWELHRPPLRLPAACPVPRHRKLPRCPRPESPKAACGLAPAARRPFRGAEGQSWEGGLGAARLGPSPAGG